jgi:hypothetical protein
VLSIKQKRRWPSVGKMRLRSNARKKPKKKRQKSAGIMQFQKKRLNCR